MKVSEEILGKIPVFARLSAKELGMVREIASVKKYEKGKVIFLEGEPFTGFYIVLSGSVKVYKLSADGSETVLHILKPYRSFAEAPVLTGSGVYPACAEAIEPVSLYHIPAVEFRRLLETSSSVSIKISEAFAGRLMELNTRLGQIQSSVEGKLAKFILGEITLNGSLGKVEPHFPLGISKKDLAAQLGMAVETLSRGLRKLKERKVIRESARTIFVLDLRRLKEISK